MAAEMIKIMITICMVCWGLSFNECETCVLSFNGRAVVSVTGVKGLTDVQPCDVLVS